VALPGDSAEAVVPAHIDPALEASLVASALPLTSQQMYVTEFAAGLAERFRHS
jgi:hypothetical protein